MSNMNNEVDDEFDEFVFNIFEKLYHHGCTQWIHCGSNGSNIKMRLQMNNEIINYFK